MPVAHVIVEAVAHGISLHFFCKSLICIYRIAMCFVLGLTLLFGFLSAISDSDSWHVVSCRPIWIGLLRDVESVEDPRHLSPLCTAHSALHSPASRTRQAPRSALKEAPPHLRTTLFRGTAGPLTTANH
jgi:hypothetical protein